MCRYIPYINLSHMFIAHMSYSEIPIAAIPRTSPVFSSVVSANVAVLRFWSDSNGSMSQLHLGDDIYGDFPKKKLLIPVVKSTSNYCLSPQVITKHGWLVVTSPNMAGKSAIFTAMLSMDDDENHAVIVKSQRNSKKKNWKSYSLKISQKIPLEYSLIEKCWACTVSSSPTPQRTSMQSAAWSVPTSSDLKRSHILFYGRYIIRIHKICLVKPISYHNISNIIELDI